MPYWSIAEWRARIGSSWCAQGRPYKTIRNGARIVKKELTLNRVITMMILLIILIGVNVGMRGLVVGGYHHQVISSFEGLLHALPHKIFLLKLAVIFISVLMISIPPRPSLKTYRQQSNDRTFWFLACFFIHMILFILKMFNPAISPLHWFIPTVLMLCVLNYQKAHSVLAWGCTSRQEEIMDLKVDHKRRRNLREDTKTQSVLVNKFLLDTALSISASVVMSLLLLSGDIEENPGPGSQDLDYNTIDSAQILDKDDLSDVWEEVFSIKSAYYNLGISLRLDDSDLRRIHENCTCEENALKDVLLVWLTKQYNVKRFGPPTWRMLVEAVDKRSGGNDHELAKTIAFKHAVTHASNDQALLTREREDGTVKGATATQVSQFHGEKTKNEDAVTGATDKESLQPCEEKTETDLEDVHLSIENLREVLDRTWPFRAGWMYIGIELGIDVSTLKATEINCMMAGGVEACLTAMTIIWLRNNNPKPTRLALDKALQSQRVSSTAAHDIVIAKDKRVEYNAYLKSLYKACMQACYHDEDHWPPPVTDKVFRLAMIKEGKVERRKIDDDFLMSTITGKVDDILQKKVPVELENIFKEAKGQQRKVLIEGAPGCGKSTLSQHICHQWAEGKLFQEYKHVILVRLREQEVQNAKDVADMLPRRDDSMGEEIAKALSACDGQDVLFIFDGWDEMPQTAAGRSVITNILNSNKLHKCSVIITSRPIASMSLLNMVNSRVEILGFANDELRQYFADCLDNDNSKVDILQQKIKEDPVVAGICYLPLNASILVHLFKCDNELPTTQFDIFCALICNCIYRHLKKTTKDEVSAIKSLDKLPQNVVAPYRQICEIAYKGVMEEMIIFELDSFNTLGLLQGVESFAKYGMLSRSYNFLHLSIQELLAAVHMATHLDDKQQVEQFTKLFGHPRFSAVFRFYAARTKLKTPGIKDIVIQAVKKCLVNNETTELTPGSDKSHQKSNSFNFGHKQQPLLVSLLHCLYEAQDKDLCQLVAAELKQKLDLKYINLDPADCLSVGYILTYCKDFEVNLYVCNIGDDGCKTLFKPDGDYSGLLSLDLGDNSISAEGAVAISIPMETMTNLQELTLYGNPLGEQGVRAISDVLKAMNSLLLLDLGGVYLGSEGAVALSKTLKSKTTLRKLYLHSNSIGDDGAKTISEAMKTMTNLQILDLSSNSIGDDGAKAISEAMKTMTNLRILLLGSNSIGDDGAKAISEAMKTLINIEELYLLNNCIGDNGAKAISETMKTMRKLNILDIRYNFIGEAGRAALSAAAKQSGTRIVGLDREEEEMDWEVDSETSDYSFSKDTDSS